MNCFSKCSSATLSASTGLSGFGSASGRVIELVEDDALAGEVNEEGLGVMQKVADLAGAMHDMADRCFDLLVSHQPVGGLVPVFGVGQCLVTDDDENIEIRTTAFEVCGSSTHVPPA